VTLAFLLSALAPFLQGRQADTHERVSLAASLSFGCALLSKYVSCRHGEKMRRHSAFGQGAMLAMGLVACLVCVWAGESEDASSQGALLVKLLQVFLVPIVFAGDVQLGPSFLAYLATHLVLTAYRFRADIWGAGWQWCLAVICLDASVLDLVAQRSHGMEAVDVLNSSYGTVRKLLGMFCDGFLLLSEFGAISAADQKARSALNLDKGESDVERRFMDFIELDPGMHVEPASLLVEGMRTVRLVIPSDESDSDNHGPSKHMVAEAYMMPWKLPQEGISHILGQGWVAQLVWSRQKKHAHLCAIKVIHEVIGSAAAFNENEAELFNELENIGGIATQAARATPLPQETSSPCHEPAEAPGSAGERVPFVPPDSRPSAPLRGELIEANSAEEGSERSLPASVDFDGGEEGRKDIPGGPWRAMSTVALGAGSDYQKVRKVARGSQGTVFEVKRKDGLRFALKEVGLKGVIWQRDFPKQLHDVDREVRILKSLSWASGSVVYLKDCWLQNDFTTACLVMEWLPHTLSSILIGHANKSTHPDPKDLMRWTANLCCGLASIHSQGFIHRDVKPSNILLSEDKVMCKLSDLGVSRPLQMVRPGAAYSDAGSMTSAGSAASSMFSGYSVAPGTRLYSSPEALRGGLYGTPTDMFSFGLVILEMLALKQLTEMRKLEASAQKSMRELAGEVIDKALPQATADEVVLKAVCQELLQPDAGARPSALELTERSFFVDYVEAILDAFPEMAQMREDHTS
jgi:serine/threonine protein kinase